MLRELLETQRKAESFLTVKDFEETTEFFTFRGMATTPKADLVGDVVDPLGAEYSLPVKLFSKHDSKNPIGNVVTAKVTKAGIPYEARIPKVKEPGRVQDRVNEAIHEIKYGLVSNVSIGFKGFADAVEALTGGGLRFKRWKWLELSLAPIPANDEATITSFKSLDGEIRGALAAQNRAGNGLTKPPGAAGLRSERATMKSVTEQLQDMQEKRAELVARMREINQACEGNFKSLSAEEAKEYDDTADEMKELDRDIQRLKAMEVAIGGATEVSGVSSQNGGSRVRGDRPAAEAKKPIDPKRKGIAFAQAYKVLWRAKRFGADPIRLAQQTQGLDERVPRFIKAAVAAGSTNGTPTAGDWGMELVGEGVVADFYDFLAPTTILGKFGQGNIPELNRVPFRMPLIGMTDGGDGYWVGEGKAKPVTSFAFERNTLDPLKVAALCVVNEELLLDSSPSADTILRNALANALRRRTDIDFINPAKTAVAGVSPASITNGITPIAATGTGDADDVRVDVGNAFGAFIDENNGPQNGVWIMSAATAMRAGMMVNALGQPVNPSLTMNGGTFAGLPVITSQHVPSVTGGAYVVLVNAQDIYYADDGDVRVDTSPHASIEMSDNPEGESGTVVNMFQTNRVAFRAERRIDWMRRRPQGVVVLSGVNWGTV
jgi:HK97 family phage major capsid protein/HK97 family phage prohead protease